MPYIRKGNHHPRYLATLSGPRTGAVGQALSYSVSLDTVADQPYTIIPIITGDASVSPTSPSIVIGGTSTRIDPTQMASATS